MALACDVTLKCKSKASTKLMMHASLLMNSNMFYTLWCSICFVAIFRLYKLQCVGYRVHIAAF